MDVDGLKPGIDFVKTIEGRVLSHLLLQIRTQEKAEWGWVLCRFTITRLWYGAGTNSRVSEGSKFSEVWKKKSIVNQGHVKGIASMSRQSRTPYEC
jgi:hypothetical protein